MRSFSIYVRCLAVAFLILSLSRPLSAQPGPGVQWVDRACAYAQDFYQWPSYNDYYCDWHAEGVDCANFCSQIANAGCAGMCESNNTNWEDWTQGDCVAYRYYGNYDDHCTNCDGSENHEVQNYAGWQSWWFWDNIGDWPDDEVNVTNLSDVPDWVGPGVFFFAHLIDPDGWHAMFIGAGQGPNARYWAHTTDRHDYPISNMFYWSRFDWAEFYGSGESPVTILKAENPLPETEQEGEVK